MRQQDRSQMTGLKEQIAQLRADSIKPGNRVKLNPSRPNVRVSNAAGWSKIRAEHGRLRSDLKPVKPVKPVPMSDAVAAKYMENYLAGVVTTGPLTGGKFGILTAGISGPIKVVTEAEFNAMGGN